MSTTHLLSIMGLQHCDLTAAVRTPPTLSHSERLGKYLYTRCSLLISLKINWLWETGHLDYLIISTLHQFSSLRIRLHTWIKKKKTLVYCMHALLYRQPLISHFESWKIWDSDDVRIKEYLVSWSFLAKKTALFSRRQSLIFFKMQNDR